MLSAIAILHDIIEPARAGASPGRSAVPVDPAECKQANDELRTSREQLRRLAARLQTVREEERTRIARDIHDQLGQMLTALKIELSQIARKLSQGGDVPAVLEQVGSISGLIDTTIRSVQRLASELRPRILDDFGLATAIEWEAQGFQSRTGIRAVIVRPLQDATLAPNLSTAVSTAVFRIFQEILTNVVRHANATVVRISLRHRGRGLLLQVRDNGRGITANEIADPASLGLLGMRERALAWGGEVKIRGVLGKGTLVAVRIPIKSPKRSSPVRRLRRERPC